MNAEFYNNLMAMKNALDASTGNQFNNRIGVCLDTYCRNKNLHGHSTRQQGGDKKADYYIEETNTYFQLYSGGDTSFATLRNKFRDDLTVLCENLNNGVYTGKLDTFYFVFTTRDQQKPNDINHELPEIVNLLRKKFGHFEWYFLNVYEITEILFVETFSLDDLQRINGNFGVVTNNEPVKIMDEMKNALLTCPQIPKSDILDYKRISTIEKLQHHNLLEYNSIIDTQIIESDYFSRIDFLTKHESTILAFSNFKNYTIKEYESLIGKGFTGKELFNTLVTRQSEIMGLISYNTMQYMILFILDHCDIFKIPGEGS